MTKSVTPGPWYPANSSSHQGLIISEATGANVAVSYDSVDASLIAAAPDLLSALEKAVIHLQAQADLTSSQGHEVGEKWQEAIYSARGAIAKAKGGAP